MGRIYGFLCCSNIIEAVVLARNARWDTAGCMYTVNTSCYIERYGERMCLGLIVCLEKTRFSVYKLSSSAHLPVSVSMCTSVVTIATCCRSYPCQQTGGSRRAGRGGERRAMCVENPSLE